jgi:hypothetical protein
VAPANDLPEEQRLQKIGFIISRTVDVERTISFFIIQFRMMQKIELDKNPYTVVAELSTKKKIQELFRLIRENPEMFQMTNEVKEGIKKIGKLRNHIAHEAFSFDKIEEKYRFIKQQGNSTYYPMKVIDEYEQFCTYIEKEISKLTVKISKKK